jgi:hypothetical protein
VQAKGLACKSIAGVSSAHVFPPGLEGSTGACCCYTSACSEWRRGSMAWGTAC